MMKLPVYAALKGCEISAQRAFLSLNHVWCSLILLLLSLGKANENYRKEVSATVSSIKHLKQFTISNSYNLQMGPSCRQLLCYLRRKMISQLHWGRKLLLSMSLLYIPLLCSECEAIISMFWHNCVPLC